MATVYIVELWECGEREGEPFVFATEELATEFAIRYPGYPKKRGPGAIVRTHEVLTELPPIEEEKPVEPYILILGSGGTSRIITDPEEMEKARANALASIHSWGGPVSQIPTLPKKEESANV